MKTALRIAFLVALAWQGWHAWTATRYERYYREGKQAYAQAQVSEISGWFEEARSVSDKDAELWAWLGDASLYEYDYNNDGVEIDEELGFALLDRAWMSYAGSVRRCPPYAWSWAGLARTMLRRIRLQERSAGIDITALARLSEGMLEPTRALALSAATVARDLKPRGFQELDVLAEVYSAAGDREKARQYLVQSARLMPAPSYHEWSEGERMYGREYQAILEALEEGIAQAPEFERDVLNIEMGRFAADQSDPKRALEYFRRAEQQATGEYQLSRALWEQARVLEELGRFDEALDVLSRAIEGPFRPEAALQRMARLLDTLGRYEDACASYRKVLVQRPDLSSIRIRAARACEEAEEFYVAEGLLKEGFVSPLEDIQLAGALVSYYRRNGRTNTLAYLLERWMEEYPGESQLEQWAMENGVPVP